MTGNGGGSAAAMEEGLSAILRAVRLIASPPVSAFGNKVTLASRRSGRYGYTVLLHVVYLRGRELAAMNTFGHTEIVEESEEIECVAECYRPLQNSCIDRRGEEIQM
jgi:hypothetical protein